MLIWIIFFAAALTVALIVARRRPRVGDRVLIRHIPPAGVVSTPGALSRMAGERMIITSTYQDGTILREGGSGAPRAVRSADLRRTGLRTWRIDVEDGTC